MVSAAMLLQLFADRWWPVIGLLYGPRWVLGIAMLPTVPWLLMSPRRGIIPAALTAVAFAFGILDLRIGLGRLEMAAGPPMRVIEFNVAGSATDASKLSKWLRIQQPAVVVLVECRPDIGEALASTLDLHVRTGGSLCLLSEYPIDDWEARDQLAFWKRGGSGAIARARLRHPGGSLRIGMVHLATPRHVLDTFGDLSEALGRGDAVAKNTALRDDESKAARDWIGSPSDVALIAGDFNLPIESAVYREHWADYANAWSQGGMGLGHTKFTRFFGVRIDHVLTGRGVSTRRTVVGPGFGSDHRPIIADLTVE